MRSAGRKPLPVVMEGAKELFNPSIPYLGKAPLVVFQASAWTYGAHTLCINLPSKGVVVILKKSVNSEPGT